MGYICRMRKRKSKSVPEWQVMRLRASPAPLVGYVSARDEKAALQAAIKQFNVRSADQRRLVVLRRS
jgi:hypothetical protein